MCETDEKVTHSPNILLTLSNAVVKQGDLLKLESIHACKDGRLGVLDLIGAIPDASDTV